MDLLIIIVVGALLVAGVLIPYVMRQRKVEQKTAEVDLMALKYGLKEPTTISPVIDPNACICTGNCVEVCPEEIVIGIQNGQATAIAPARCVGHGLCERACPVDAIQLVFGSEKRGVDIPRIRENFETNVDGIYIVGELGGMGLIWNAFEQGRQCIEGILKEDRTTPSDTYDLIVVGCGPAGLAASLHAKHNRLKYLTLEKEADYGGAVRSYPRKKLVMTNPVLIPGYGKFNFSEIIKEDLVAVWDDVITKTGLTVQLRETVKSVSALPDGCFEVHSTADTYKTRRVVVAIGRRGVPRKLGVPGEDAGNVAYALRDPEYFSNHKIVVVGGGDSAVEAALALAEQPGNQVSISYRKSNFSRCKPANVARIQSAIGAGNITPLLQTNLKEITEKSVTYVDEAGEIITQENEYVFVFIGGELPTTFLKDCGIEIDTKFGVP